MSQSAELHNIALMSLLLVLGYLLQDAWLGGNLYTRHSALFLEYLSDLQSRISNLCAENLTPLSSAFIALQIVWLLIYLDLLKLKKELAKDGAKLKQFYWRDRRYCLTGLRERYAPLMQQAQQFQSLIARKEQALVKAEIEMQELELEIDRIVWSHMRNLRANDDPNWIYLPALCYGYHRDPGGDRIMMRNELTVLNEMRNNQIQELIWKDVQRIMSQDKPRDCRKRKHRSDRSPVDVNLGRFQTEILGRPGTPAEPLEALMTLEEMKRATKKRTVMPEEKQSRKRSTKNTSCCCDIATDQPIIKDRKHRHRSKRHKPEDPQKETHSQKTRSRKKSAERTKVPENRRSFQICNLSTSKHNFEISAKPGNHNNQTKLDQAQKENSYLNRPSSQEQINPSDNATVQQEFIEINSTDTIKDQRNEDAVFFDGIVYEVETDIENKFAKSEPFGMVLEEIDGSRMHQEYRTAVLEDPKIQLITATNPGLDFLVDISGDAPLYNDYVNVIETARSAFPRSLSNTSTDIPKSPSPRRSLKDFSFSGNELLSYTPISKHRMLIPENTFIIALETNILGELVSNSKECISSQSSPFGDSESISEVEYSESILLLSQSEIPLGEGSGTLDFSSNFDDLSTDGITENASSVTSITIYTDKSGSLIDICEFGLESNADLRQDEDQIQMSPSIIEIEEDSYSSNNYSSDYSSKDDRKKKNLDGLFGNFAPEAKDLIVLWKEKSDPTKD